MVNVDDAAALARRRVVTIGRTGEKELLLDIALLAEVHRCGVVRIAVIRMSERRGVGDRPGDVGRPQHDMMGLLASRSGGKREGHCCGDEQKTHRKLLSGPSVVTPVSETVR
jgi:hypothetical protein